MNKLGSRIYFIFPAYRHVSDHVAKYIDEKDHMNCTIIEPEIKCIPSIE